MVGSAAAPGRDGALEAGSDRWQVEEVTDAEAVKIMRAHLEGLFPKICPTCQRCFTTLRDYVLHTERVGTTVSFDAEMGQWDTKNPIGTVAHANCPCGTTLALTSEGIPLDQMKRLLDWARTETHRRGLSLQQLLDLARDEIRRQVLTEPDSSP